MLRSKFDKFLLFLKQQIRFSSNFLSLFSVMRHNSSILFKLTFYILSTKGAYQCKSLVKFHVGSGESLCTLMGSFCYLYKVSAKKLQKRYLSWHWRVMQRKTDLRFQVWYDEFGEFSPNHSKVWKFFFDGLFLSKVYKV